MALVFINYRTLDQPGYATLIDRELVEQFGAQVVFRDSRSIRPGSDFASTILAVSARRFAVPTTRLTP